MPSRRELEGPFDYNRYPPRGAAARRSGQTRRASAPATASMSDTTPTQPAGSEPRRNPPRRRLPPHAVDELPRARSGPHHRVPPSSASYAASERWAQQERARYGATRNDEPADEMADDEIPQTPTTPRRRRKPARPLWKRLRLGAAVLLVMGLIELGAAALTAPQFAVVGVDVMGLQVTPEDAVHSITAQLEGQNWVQARTAQIEREVESLPAVKQATIQHVLGWPPRLVMDVEERQPFLKVGAGDAWWVVDAAGIPFRRATTDDAGLYAVTGPKLVAHEGRALPSGAWQAVAQLADALAADNQVAEAAQPGSSWKLRRIYLDKNGFAAVRLKGGAQDSLLVRLGDERWRDKLQRARVALSYFERSGARAEVLNLVSFDMPTWTPQRRLAEAAPASADVDSQSLSTLPLPTATTDSDEALNGAGETLDAPQGTT